MKEIPILFSTAMVQAILKGRKTMTRRIVSPQPDDDGLWNDTKFPRSLQSTLKGWNGCVAKTGESKEFKCRYGQPGDILWVRESSASTVSSGPSKEHKRWYKADNVEIPERTKFKWKPSIHMPKAAVRIWLEVTEIRVEQLQDITPGDACDEGVNYWNIDSDSFEGGELQADFENYTWTEKKENDKTYKDRHFPTFANPVDSFRSLWESINGEESWLANPWVWVVSFKVLSTTGRHIKSTNHLKME